MNECIHRFNRIIAIVIPALLLICLSCERVDIYDASDEAGTVSGSAITFSRGGSALTSGDTIDFGTGTVGNSVSLTLTITNSGTEVLSFTGCSIQGTDYSNFGSTSYPSSLNPTASCDITITFTPDDNTARTACYTITISGTTYSFLLKGTAI